MVLRVPTDCGGVGRSKAAFIPGQCGWLTPALAQAATARRACSASRRRLRIHSAASPLRTALSPSRAEPATPRSEEHTSELQSHHDLVCRLLLEKKKKKKKANSVQTTKNNTKN